MSRRPQAHIDLRPSAWAGARATTPAASTTGSAAPVLSQHDTVNSSPIKDKIVTGDARHMDEVEDASVALVVTSPPYFAGKEYEEALGEGHIPASYLDYLGMLTEVFAECVRTLEPGGRIAVNVANLGRKPYRSLSADVITILQDRLGLLLRGEVVWLKARGASGSCAWGSFRSPANPVLRDLTERVVIASKGRFDRALSRPARQERGLPSGISLTKEEFIEATTDVWELPSERATRVGHPAPFPVELPLRLIELYTYEGDLVLDPFMGSGIDRGGRAAQPPPLRRLRHRVRVRPHRRATHQRRARPAHRTRRRPPRTTPARRHRGARRGGRDAQPVRVLRRRGRASARSPAWTSPSRRATAPDDSGSSTSPAPSAPPTPACGEPTPCGRRSARRPSSTRRGPRSPSCSSPPPPRCGAVPGNGRGDHSVKRRRRAGSGPSTTWSSSARQKTRPA